MLFSSRLRTERLARAPTRGPSSVLFGKVTRRSASRGYIQVLDADEVRSEVIQVDSFDPEAFEALRG